MQFLAAFEEIFLRFLVAFVELRQAAALGSAIVFHVSFEESAFHRIHQHGQLFCRFSSQNEMQHLRVIRFDTQPLLEAAGGFIGIVSNRREIGGGRF